MAALCECSHERDDHADPDGGVTSTTGCLRSDCDCEEFVPCHTEPSWV